MRKNGKKLLWIAAGVAVIAALALGWKHQRGDRENAAEAARWEREMRAAERNERRRNEEAAIRNKSVSDYFGGGKK